MCLCYHQCASARCTYDCKYFAAIYLQVFITSNLPPASSTSIIFLTGLQSTSRRKRTRKNITGAVGQGSASSTAPYTGPVPRRPRGKASVSHQRQRRDDPTAANSGTVEEIQERQCIQERVSEQDFLRFSLVGMAVYV